MEKEGPKFILVVDNDRMVREALARAMNFPPVNALTVEAASSDEAEAAFNFTIPDLLITDLEMGKKTGWDLVDFIRNLEDRDLAAIPIIVLSAGIGLWEEFEQKKEQNSKAMSRVYVFEKPIADWRAFLDLIAELLRS